MEAIIVLLAVSYGLIALVVLDRTAIRRGVDTYELTRDTDIR